MSSSLRVSLSKLWKFSKAAAQDASSLQRYQAQARHAHGTADGSDDPPMALWTCRSSRGTRVLWTLHELGVADQCTLITMPFPPRVHAPEFLRKNILGTVPYFEDGEGCRMTESVAICMYLANKYAPTTLVIQPDEPDYSSYLNWLAHADATLTFPQTVVLRYSQQELHKADAAVEGYARFYLARLRLLSSALLDGREYLCGNRFTIADVVIAFALNLGTQLPVSTAPGSKALSAFYKPQVAQYMERMLSRPGYTNARAAEDHALEQFRAKHPAPKL
eukprot:m.536646 g.536646  ORF g.536646 m.536646 type:complete len:277 (+) comp22072_c0_seq14:229-1059(+)